MIIKYPEYPKYVNRDYDYEVTLIQGEEEIKIPVYNSARQPSSFAGADGDSYRRFCEFSFTGEITVKIKVRTKMQSYAILPRTELINSTCENGVVTFKLTKPQNLVFRINKNLHSVLAIFAEAPETEIPKGDNVITFKAGLNNAPEYKLDEKGRFHVPANSVVYLEAGALVMARMILEGSNVTICGRGAFMDPRMDRNSGFTYMFDSWKKFEPNTNWPNKMHNLLIQGVKFLDSHCFNLTFGKIDDVEVDNVKLLANQISADSFSLWDGQNENFLIHNCFIYCSDDCFVMQSPNTVEIRDCIIGNCYGIFYPEGNIKNVYAENITLFGNAKLFKCWVNVGDAPSWNVHVKNVYCENNEQAYQLSIRDQNPGAKNIVLENAVFNDETDRVFVIQNSKGVNVEFKNTFFETQPITSIDNFTTLTICHEGNEAKFTQDGNFTPVNSPERKAYYEGDKRIYIGGYCLPLTKTPAYEKDGEIFLPHEVLRALNVGQIPKTDNVTASLLRDCGLKVEMQDGNVHIAPPFMNENLIYEESFEECENEFVSSNENDWDYIQSRVWNAFNFGTLRVSNNAHSGKKALLLQKFGVEKQSGVAQLLTPAIKKYGNGKYEIRFFSKHGTLKNPENSNIRVGIVQSNWRIYGDDGELLPINDVKEFTVTPDWQECVYVVDIKDITHPNYNSAYFYIGLCEDKKSNSDIPIADVLIDDVSVKFLG